jgi:RecA/RadA recombinase
MSDQKTRLEARMAYRRARPNRLKELTKSGASGAARLYKTTQGEYSKAVNRLVETIGTGMIVDRGPVQGALAYSTGIPSLDSALGGGIPSGLTEIYGAEGVGKSTLVFEMIRSAQQVNLEVALATGEYLDVVRAQNLGVDLSRLTLIRGSSGEDVLDVCVSFVAEDRRALFIDSLTSVRPKIDEFNEWLVMVLSWVKRTRTQLGRDSSVVAVNQVRTRRSINPRLFFADGTTSTAHKIAGEFDTRVELSRTNVHEDRYDLVVNVVANLLSAPNKIVTLPVAKTGGVEVWIDVVRAAEQLGVFTKHGSVYYCNEQMVGRGEKDTAHTLATNKELGAYVFEAVLQA